MNITKQKIFVTTFRKGENQGLVVPVGVMELEVRTRNMPVIFFDGCISGEIKEREVQTVIIKNREFEIKDGFGRDFVNSGAQFQVSIPPDLADSIKLFKCPHCECQYISIF